MGLVCLKNSKDSSVAAGGRRAVRYKVEMGADAGCGRLLKKLWL